LRLNRSMPGNITNQRKNVKKKKQRKTGTGQKGCGGMGNASVVSLVNSVAELRHVCPPNIFNWEDHVHSLIQYCMTKSVSGNPLQSLAAVPQIFIDAFSACMEQLFASASGKQDLFNNDVPLFLRELCDLVLVKSIGRRGCHIVDTYSYDTSGFPTPGDAYVPTTTDGVPLWGVPQVQGFGDFTSVVFIAPSTDSADRVKNANTLFASLSNNITMVPMHYKTKFYKNTSGYAYNGGTYETPLFRGGGIVLYHEHPITFYPASLNLTSSDPTRQVHYSVTTYGPPPTSSGHRLVRQYKDGQGYSDRVRVNMLDIWEVYDKFETVGTQALIMFNNSPQTTLGATAPWQNLDPTALFNLIQYTVATAAFPYSPVYVNLKSLNTQYVPLPWGCQFFAPDSNFNATLQLPLFFIETLRAMGPVRDVKLGFATWTYPVPVGGFQSNGSPPAGWVNTIYPETYDSLTLSFPTTNPPTYVVYSNPPAGGTGIMFTDLIQSIQLINGLVELEAVNQIRERDYTMSKYLRIVVLNPLQQFQSGSGSSSTQMVRRSVTPTSDSKRVAIRNTGTTRIDFVQLEINLASRPGVVNNVTNLPYNQISRSPAASLQVAIGSMFGFPQSEQLLMGAVLPIVPVSPASSDPNSIIVQNLSLFQVDSFNTTMGNTSIMLRVMQRQDVLNFVHVRGSDAVSEAVIWYQNRQRASMGGAFNDKLGGGIGKILFPRNPAKAAIASQLASMGLGAVEKGLPALLGML